ncbi:GPI-anchor transamidase precursor [Colletotrichum tofieldiae]|uniref:GPI-anchor transamidase n=1 Tax=Colletotrichum tofieldiae TaxID=708197 RepID=A0A166NPX9_9PEZI|nr:GPI-anchor transamidase precursor [Colletotrichum tofieldiae]
MDEFEALAKALDPNFSAYDEPLTHLSGFQIPPLKTLTLKSRPLTSHALTFSCDAELAVAADDSIHVFLPEFPTPEGPTSTSTTTKPSSAPKDHGSQEAAERDPAGIAAAAAVADAQNSSKTSRQQFYTYILRIPTSRKPDPRMNAALFAAQGLVAPTYDDDYGTSTGGGVAEDPFSAFEGVGSGTVTGYGASLNQVVAIEWSPAGLGRNLRAVLAVMLTSGALLVFGEGGGGGMVDLGARMRNFRDWRILWGVGANLPLPDAGSEDGAYLPKDKVRSFSWAKYLGPGQALMAYATDQEEVVVLSVQYYLPNQFDADSDAGSHVWEVEELARFDARGPHPSTNIMDPDYIPYTSAFSLKWSPWLHSDGSRTAVLAYCARNYVGFRRFTIPSDWARGVGVEVAVEEADLTGICTNLLSDAFVEWEEAIWNRDGAKVCRGVIASPFKALPFQVALNGPEGTTKEPHATSVCNTTFPEDTTSLGATNPITSLIIHPPDTSKQREAPTYSLIRLSATATNDNWFQQSTGDPSSPSVVEALPKWAEAISSTVKLSVPVAMLSRGVGAVGGDAESVASGEDSDSDDDDFDLPEDAGEQIHPHRVRMWGMTMSPAGGMSAVLVSQHSTQKPEKSVKTKVMFGGRSGAVAALPPLGDEMEVDVDENAGGGRNEGFWARQSTEAKMWDWMYAGGPAVPGTLGSGEGARAGDVLLRKRFEEVKNKQRCVFCQTTLTDEGKESICEKGHTFATCAATGLAILAPGISRACAVCGLRCLVAKEVVKIAQEHLGPDAKVEASEEMCGGCGGKFVV